MVVDLYTIRMAWFDIFVHKTLGRPHTLTKVYDEGAGAPVVLLHGIASSSKLWEPLVSLHDDKSRMVSFDLLGFGDSPKPNWLDYTVEQHAKAVEKSIRKLRIKQPITLVGHSMGCLVAIHIAFRNPSLVKHLVLFEPPLLVDVSHIRTYNRRRKAYIRAFGYIASNQERITKYSHHIGKVFSKVTAFKLDDRDWIPFERSLRNTIMQQSAYQELSAIKTPTDIIFGRNDRIVIRAKSQRLLGVLPHVRLHTVAEVHGLTKRSARYLLGVIQSGLPSSGKL